MPGISWLFETCVRAVLDQQPKDRMPALWAMSDVSMVLLKKSDLFKTVIPSKIFESMAMGKPLIMGVEGESLELVESAGAGLAMRPESGDDLANCVLRLAENPSMRDRLGRCGRDFVAKYYDRSVLAQRYIDAISELLANRKEAKRVSHS